MVVFRGVISLTDFFLEANKNYTLIYLHHCRIYYPQHEKKCHTGNKRAHTNCFFFVLMACASQILRPLEKNIMNQVCVCVHVSGGRVFLLNHAHICLITCLCSESKQPETIHQVLFIKLWHVSQKMQVCFPPRKTGIIFPSFKFKVCTSP